MKHIYMALLMAAVLLAPGPALALDSDVQALLKQVEKKPAIEQNAQISVDVVAYELQNDPRTQKIYKAVAQAGGGSYSDAQIKDISAVMQSVVTGKATPAPTTNQSGWKQRLEKGETLIIHGRPDLID